MNSLEIMAKEIKRQVRELPKIKRYDNNNDGCSEYLFVGSGDSYVAGLIASYASDFKSICIDPAEIVINPSIAKDKKVFIISISGRTRENILAVKKIKKYCKETIAITANPCSLLAKNCDRLITLDYRTFGVTTSGTIGFIFSAITCLYLIYGFQKIKRVQKIFENAEIVAEDLSNQLSPIYTSNNNQSIIFLGNSILYPISIYGSLKINEVFAEKAFAYTLEGFCHSPIFSISKKDIVIILSASQFNLNKKANALAKQLNNNHIPAFVIQLDSNKISDRKNNRHSIKKLSRLGNIEILLFSTFLVQLFIYKLAKKKKLEECIFLKKKNILKISSQLIY